MRENSLDVGFTYRSLKADLDAAYASVMDFGMYIGGAALDAFEAEFAAWCGARYCVGLGNGLEALVLPLRARGIGPGDEVIVPAHTFIATWLAVAQTGATPVPVDADPVTIYYLGKIEAAITGSHPRDHAGGTSTARRAGRGLARPLRCARADAAGRRQRKRTAHKTEPPRRCHRPCGISFYPGKNLGAFGDGGALVTDDAELADKVRMLSNYGSRAKYQHDLAGGNSRLDPLQAAFLSVKLKHLEAWNARRQDIAAV